MHIDANSAEVYTAQLDQGLGRSAREKGCMVGPSNIGAQATSLQGKKNELPARVNQSVVTPKPDLASDR